MMANHLENLEKSGNLKVVREKSGNRGKVREGVILHMVIGQLPRVLILTQKCREIACILFPIATVAP